MRRTLVNKSCELGGTNLFNCLALLFACIVLYCFIEVRTREPLKRFVSSFDKRAMAINHAFLTHQIFRCIFRWLLIAGWVELFIVKHDSLRSISQNILTRLRFIGKRGTSIPTGL